MKLITIDKDKIDKDKVDKNTPAPATPPLSNNDSPNNPLVDPHSLRTIKNITRMVTRIQVFATKHFANKGCQPQCPATELYISLLTMVNEAIEYEIKKNRYQ